MTKKPDHIHHVPIVSMNLSLQAERQ